jgi:microcystin-dependent protein
MSDYFLGEIRMFGANFAIKNWATCDGQLLSISQNSALFSLIGTTYGGDGRTTFALPDLRGRLPIGEGQGPGLTMRTMGEKSGTEQITVTINQIPLHSHTFNATTADATVSDVGSTVLTGKPGSKNAHLYAVPGSAGSPTNLASGVVGFTGGNLPHDNVMPSLCLTFIIALTGIFPRRN